MSWKVEYLPEAEKDLKGLDGSQMTETEQGSHSELGLPAKRKMPDSRDGRYTHRPAVPPPADDICQCVKLRYGILNPL